MTTFVLRVAGVAAILDAVPSRMVKPDCPRCKSSALVRKETVVKAGETVESFYCGRCDHTWAESGDRSVTPKSDGERPDRSRPTARRPVS